MANNVKPRHFQVDNRHHIPDPVTNPRLWAKTVTVERVGDLYKTAHGMPGHLVQIQQELNRLSLEGRKKERLDCCSSREVVAISEAIDKVWNALTAVKKKYAKMEVNFDNPGQALVYHPWDRNRCINFAR